MMSERYRYFFGNVDGQVLLESALKQRVTKETEQGMINRLSKQFELPLTAMYDGACYHMCRCCRKIAIGQDEDILCEGCANETGHARFNKLNKSKE